MLQHTKTSKKYLDLSIVRYGPSKPQSFKSVCQRAARHGHDFLSCLMTNVCSPCRRYAEVYSFDERSFTSIYTYTTKSTDQNVTGQWIKHVPLRLQQVYHDLLPVFYIITSQYILTSILWDDPAPTYREACTPLHM